MLLFGGSLPDAWDAAAAAFAEGRVGTLVLVGGVGHTSDVLRGLLGDAQGRTEADLMAAYLRREHGIEDVLLERQSSNCGENVVLARDLVRGAGLAPARVALVQDPTMQRRMDAGRSGRTRITRASVAITIGASISARSRPMQRRGPAPNGK
jgi:uncharacterized SAM-binding protein YcdF (DUF218 family)